MGGWQTPAMALQYTLSIHSWRYIGRNKQLALIFGFVVAYAMWLSILRWALAPKLRPTKVSNPPTHRPKKADTPPWVYVHFSQTWGKTRQTHPPILSPPFPFPYIINQPNPSPAPLPTNKASTTSGVLSLWCTSTKPSLYPS